MDASVTSFLTDPRLIEMALCLAVIGLLRWIDLKG
jgi:hypothetical protein